MYNPCFECFNRYGTQYSEECDSTCEYARVCLENKNLKKQVLTGLERLELEKAMMGRSVDYATTRKILSDFQIRMDRFKK